MNTFRNRQPQGIPTGGQFAATTHSESSISLGGPPRPDLVIHDPSIDSEAVQELAAAGLKGGLFPARESQDLPEGSVELWTDGARLGISGLGTDEVAVKFLSDDPNREFTMTHSNKPSTEDIMNAIEAAQWKDKLTDVFAGSFRDGEDFEVRDNYLGRNSHTGDYVAGMTVSTHTGDWFTLDHNFTTGQTTVDSESWMNEKPFPQDFVDPIISDLTGKDAYGEDAQRAAAEAFGKVKERAEQMPGYEKFSELA
ncbi:hypothetical protein [Arthrobacter caoxuetaonis]|uniref:Uncharacterized protein n=1 Tax=Arthrobacter caoxuetaonis TaxID=2886935 RepID=A0A9X1MIS2_9MICC|nr:hypothetical protein [Arthrobacter caoxuetaonis]MCC3299314.1 hypothetical protein [Arthrobacter caoxuetaonis]USQ59193.1 hypothetical protein NF551_16550 [Arthrobacter caoxuetaonis]